MRVYVYPGDLYGCGYYRLIWPGKVLAALGHDVIVVPPGDRNNITGVINDGKMVDVNVPEDADVICLQRPTHKWLSEMIPLVRAKGIAVVVDMDDDLAYIHPQNPAFVQMHPQNKGDHSWRNAELACSRATAVVTSTPPLFRHYAPHGRGAVLRNCVPYTYLAIDEDKDYRGFGWAGSVQSHPDDLQVVGDAARRLTRDGFKYFAVGPAWRVKENLQLDESPEAFGTLELAEYPLEVARLEVGIAPLADTRFNRAKSWLKPLEYAALGTACVMSPLPEYLNLNRRGVGVVAKNPKEWYRKTKELLVNTDFRNEIVQSGREAALELTMEKNAWRWLEVWEDAYKLDR